MQQDSINTDDTAHTHELANAVAQEAKNLQNQVLSQSAVKTEHAGHNEHTANPILALQEVLQSITQETVMLEKVREQEQEHFENLLKETDTLRQKLNTLASQYGSTNSIS